MKFYRLLSVAAATLLSLFTAAAQNQQPLTPEQREKQMLESIEKEVQRLSGLLDLEYWQEFYVDSILVHDLLARDEEIQSMAAAKVGNPDLYQAIYDKWAEQIDNSYKRFFTEEQWDKYWRTGGKKAKESRDKRRKKK